ncbi:K+-sensing histidine kinase KdpD [Methanomicrobium sp. W14]|uniref:sensor histidine kinase n=1 Tax=Methanomicrobium sp. W14 TaxID=2817839 RepID=UPI001AE9FC30|nr:ATP-binding protein [Methanomicrobium sp. W14]MBP2132729.1 K+-sensing histidine kinase KdpD [Methanomicrobium sp. W14]
MLNKVIYNIFENSLRHGKNTTEIRISFSLKENCGVMFIEDNGEGVADNMKKAVFEKGGGSNAGLGLYFTKKILDITGITIEETGKYHVGAVFEISVPNRYWRTRC